jgi:hypothetical protein
VAEDVDLHPVVRHHLVIEEVEERLALEPHGERPRARRLGETSSTRSDWSGGGGTAVQELASSPAVATRTTTLRSMSVPSPAAGRAISQGTRAKAAARVSSASSPVSSGRRTSRVRPL